MVHKKHLFLTILASTFIVGCQSKVSFINNEALTRVGETYENMYPSTFSGEGPHHPYDEIDFLKPHEKKTLEKPFFGFAFSGIDKTYGYDFANLLYSNIEVKSENHGHITWLGHASFLIQQVNGDAFVTDPVFDEFDGFGWLGSKLDYSLKRLGEAPIKGPDLPFVDGIVISHNHYDHLNNNSLNSFYEGTHLYLPLDNADDVDFDKGPITEMDWFTSVNQGSSTINFLPANHTSNRSSSDHRESLWGSWLFQDGQYKVYFAGDTGYSPIFKDIYAKLGSMDVCLMPIVAYSGPAREMHLAPEDAVKAAQDLKCKVFIPWGYGTWSLGYEHVNEPLRRLAKAVEDMKPDFMLKILKMGQSLDYRKLLNK